MNADKNEPNMESEISVYQCESAANRNRIDEQIVFRPLNEDAVVRILDLMLREVCDQLQRQHGVSLKVGTEDRELIIRTGYSPAFGARELRRAIERLLQVPLSQLILKGELAKHKQWCAEAKEQGLVLVPAATD